MAKREVVRRKNEEIENTEDKESTPPEIQKLKAQIAEAIEAGDHEKAEELVDLAERLKEL